ncbi:GNAT family N-acetyltransferase [Georgenia sp. MJ173]|uniref:GNAT family N-acetyltransferase n=1 Tax=Georgenia sunbinii TaxID=3117728 RepID=UPI002F26D77D
MKFSMVDVSSAHWRDATSLIPHDVYQLPEWSELDSLAGSGSPRAIIVDDGTRSTAIPVVVRRISDTLWDASSPYGYPGFAAGHGFTAKMARELVLHLSEFLRTMGCVSLFLRLHPTLNNASAWPDEFTRLVGKTLILDLTVSIDEIQSSIRKGHKSDIKRAVREGLEVVEDSSEEAYREFQRIYEQTMRRVDAADYYQFDRDYFNYLRINMRSMVRLYLAVQDHDVAGGALFLEAPSSGIVQYHLSATADRHLGLQPSKSIIHRAIHDSRDRDFSLLHLGGGLGGNSDSLYNFKKGFGATPVDYRTVQLITNADAYHELSAGTPAGSYFPTYRMPSQDSES